MMFLYMVFHLYLIFLNLNILSKFFPWYNIFDISSNLWQYLFLIFDSWDSNNLEKISIEFCLILFGQLLNFKINFIEIVILTL